MSAPLTFPVRKKHPHVAFDTRDYYGNGQSVELTDALAGFGVLHAEGLGNRRHVEDGPPTRDQWGYTRTPYHYEFDRYRLVGRATPREYQDTFGLKLYEDGSILPASKDGATTFATLAEAAAFAEKWLAAGAPGLSLEDPAETARLKRAEHSAYNRGKAERYLSSLTDEDLQKLAEKCTQTIAKRAETEAKAAERAAEKRRRAEEKVRVAAEKAAAKAEKAAKKAAKDAEKAAKAAERARKQAEREAKAAAKAVAAPAPSPQA